LIATTAQRINSLEQVSVAAVALTLIAFFKQRQTMACR